MRGILAGVQYNEHRSYSEIMPMLNTTYPTHVRQVLMNQKATEEDKKEILALLKFVRRPMSAKEIAEANDIPFSRAKRLLDELTDNREIMARIEGAKVVFVPD